MESDASSPHGRSRRAQTQQDVSDPSPKSQRPRPQSMYGSAEGGQDLRSAASQVSAREQHPARSASTRHGSSNSSSRLHQLTHRDRGRETSTTPHGSAPNEFQDFLRQFSAIDLPHASQLWASDKQRISTLESDLHALRNDWASAAISFLSHFRVRDFAEASEQWAAERKNLADAEGKFHRLQNEVLTTVDRFQPTYDETICERFGMLQAAIGVFVNQNLMKAVKLDRWEKWDQSALWEGAVNTDRVGKEGLQKREEKLLVRQAVWKFLAEALFERGQPFASFGGAAGELAGRWVFDGLWPDHELNEDAAKWRSLTVKQLSSRADDEQGRSQLHKGLADAFVVHVLENMTSMSPEEIETSSAPAKLATSDKLDDVLKQAVALSRILMGERASFALRPPSLEKMKFEREKMDGSTTIVGSEVNLVFNEEDDDKAGVVKLFASPMLVKFGNAGGQDLHQEMVLLRAFVILA
ncbi:hypothetical protein B0H67DRAFT_551472 [Lasiosphaeris hirsuta]|uniref:Uncharacterized protein n=1 Tax=Lasiosphaeris hirsuta TaxID=260670 RepID=A0AA40E6Q6_9PEZI|nr:hypothetical protein B0H67DRAFT_551472 [Lasiosphaeris hirsuta]